MKKFLKELELKKETIYSEEYGNVDGLTSDFFGDMHRKYSRMEGLRALYKDKGTRANYVVRVIKAYPHYVLLQRNCYGLSESSTVFTTANYGSLFCGESSLELEG